jgi:hypothetical protein
MTHRSIIIHHDVSRWIYPWVATYDNYDGPGSPIGTGATEKEALEELLAASEARLSAQLSARVVDLERALAFYADGTNYVGHRDPDASVYVETSAIDTDGGRRAREALGGV